MYYFKSFLEELSLKSVVKFNIITEDGEIVYLGEEIDEDKRISVKVSLGSKEYFLVMNKEYHLCMPIVKYYIEERYSQLFYLREQFFIDVIQGNKVCLDKLNEIVPFLKEGGISILIKVDGSKYEALNILKAYYYEKQVVTMLYDNELLAIGNFENIEEECKAIKELITGKLCCKCSISYGSEAFTIESIKKSYEEAKEAMNLGEKLGGKNDIYDYNEMLFEKAIFSMSDKVKKEYLKEFKDKFSNFDEEMINTIEEFISCNLNISEAAKNLYIHRNTLIYRLDKIAKDTGYDIRNFKEATIFTIAFLIWKELN
ncbi:PucR family transcriptional regulator [Clostridium hydrogeniformans]|uniref:PucR family transcriptional regulator n=1 Tax=Clostridium hydrogeniformans TaxID=349933 RepID=UPI000484067F|nr:helix-turn-helix domain-containing protein [Clostridium hydrogeniformans]